MGAEAQRILQVWLADAVAGWLVQTVAESLVARAGVKVLGAADQQALRSVGEKVARSVADVVDNEYQEVFQDVLRQGLGDLAIESAGSSVSLLEALAQGIEACLSPLADPTRTGQQVSYLELVGVDPVRLRADMIHALVRAVQFEAATNGRLTSIASQLNADLAELRNERARNDLGPVLQVRCADLRVRFAAGKDAGLRRSRR